MNMFNKMKSQVKFDLLEFRRNPASTFFTVVLPLIFLVIFTSIFGNEELENGAKVATFYVPGILGLSIISATAVNLAIGTTIRRERGILKRLRGTPLPPLIFILSQALAAFVISIMMTILVTGIGRIFYDVSLISKGIPALAISLLVGTISFSLIGLALTSIIPSESAAPAVTNAIFLPLYFVSDVFIINEDTPEVINQIGNIFPVRHLVLALQDSFNPFIESTPMPWEHWLVIAAWGLAAGLVALKTFRWIPRR